MKKIIAVSILSLSIFYSVAQVSMISNIYSGATSSSPDFLYVANNKVYFTADDGNFGVEVWEYGTSGSVVLNYEVNSSGSSYNAAHFIEFNSKVYFAGYEGTYGTELYEYDGVGAPIRISDINPGGANSVPHSFAIFNNKLYFQAIGPGNDYELYVFDGTNAPTLVADINTTGNSYPSELFVFNNKLYFGANDGVSGFEIWSYDGVNSPSMLMDINPGANGSNPSFSKYFFTEYNSKIYFSADNGTNGAELWMFDGINPPSMVVDLMAGASSFDPRYFYVYQNKLIFSAQDPILGNELWQYDGINNPTMVFDINTNPSVGLHHGNPRHFIEYNGVLYFRATDELHGRELWGWNGVNDPEMIEDINPGTGHSSEDWNLNATKRMVVFNGSLVFAADNGTVGEELFKYDGCSVSAMINQSGEMLQASPTGATYQWFDCSTGNAIAGQTNQSYTPTSDGDYKVVIIDGLCIDTSDCFNVFGLGIENLFKSELLIYPNPANNQINISTIEVIISVKIYSMSGELILSSQQNEINVENLSNGIYQIEVETDKGIQRNQFVKN